MSAPRRRCCILLFSLALVTGIWLRWYHLGSESLWLDEGYTAWLMGLPLGRMLRAIQADYTPPLYYLILKPWTQLFGTSEFALRSWSALMGTVTLLLWAVVTCQLLRHWPARILALALIGASINQLYYSQEARCYQTGAAFFTAALLSLLTFLRSGRRGWFAAFVVAATGMVYLHNTLWFYLAALNLAWLVLPGETPLRRRLGYMLLANLLVLAAFAPWIPSLLWQMRRVHGTFWVEVPTFNHITQVIVGAAGIDAAWLRALLLPWLGLVDQGDRLFRFGTLLLLAVASGWAILTPQRRTALGLLTVAVVPILISYVYSHIGQSVFIDRTFLPSSLLLPLLLAFPLEVAAPPRWKGQTLAAIPAAVVLLLAVLSTLSMAADLRKEDWRSVVAHIDAAAAPDALLVFVDSDSEPLYHYYTRKVSPGAATGLPVGFYERDPPVCGSRLVSAQPLADLAERWLQGPPRQVLLVRTHEWWCDPDAMTASFFGQRLHLKQSIPFRGVTVEHYDPRIPAVASQ